MAPSSQASQTTGNIYSARYNWTRYNNTYRGVGVGDVHRGEWLDHGAHQQVHCADTAHRCVAVFEKRSEIFLESEYYFDVVVMNVVCGTS